MMRTQELEGHRSFAGGINRRQFLASMAAGAGALALRENALGAETPRRVRPPNILYIMTDQQHAAMMSCAGNKYLKTPAMDSLARTGVRFERAYCTNPVCLPSRFSMMTGRMPSELGIRSNRGSREAIPKAVLQQSMGWIFRRAGYDVAYGGKTHWPRGMTPATIGFDYISRNQREGLADACARFIRGKREKPFLLVASFINPHDICYMAIRDHRPGTRAPRPLDVALQLPDGVSREEFFRRHCPPLPDNYEIPPLEPACITRLLKARPFRDHARRTWSDEKWRLHRWAYCRLTEMVDAHIARILKAVRDAGLEENTLIIFASDHGDMDAAHRMEHKTALYEEAARVPFIVSYRGVTRTGLVDETHLVSAGLDLIPTMCDYARIEPPEGLRGRSVRALAEGRRPASWRDQLVVESQVGRMVRTKRYKYNVYDDGERREQLIDLENDPGEMANLAEDPKYKKVLNEHRGRLRRWLDDG